MPYWKLYYHIVWGTKNGFDFISPAWEKDLYDYLWGKAIALECIPHTINGMPNHLHVVLSVPPKLALAKTIGLLKGSSSHHINENYLDHTFAWRSIDQGDGFYISIFFISVPGGIWPEKTIKITKTVDVQIHIFPEKTFNPFFVMQTDISHAISLFTSYT